MKNSPVSNANFAISTALDERTETWHGALRGIYLHVGVEFARDVWGALDVRSTAKMARTLKQNDLEDRWQLEVLSFLEANALDRHKTDQIFTTTRETARKFVADAVAEGKSIDDIARGLEQHLATEARFRAVRIARTEIIAASNLGSQKAALATGLPLIRRWLATQDDVVRDEHSAADGQMVKGATALYSVGGEQLLYPGDISNGASAGNVINCRCTETYEVDQEASDGDSPAPPPAGAIAV